jgi:hypothetical protein
MNRKHLISDTQIAVLRSEVQHLKQNCIITPDTDASYITITNLLTEIAGA